MHVPKCNIDFIWKCLQDREWLFHLLSCLFCCLYDDDGGLWHRIMRTPLHFIPLYLIETDAPVPKHPFASITPSHSPYALILKAPSFFLWHGATSFPPVQTDGRLNHFLSVFRVFPEDVRKMIHSHTLSFESDCVHNIGKSFEWVRFRWDLMS